MALRPALWHAVCRSCSFPVLCPICQAKSEPKCIPCSKRQAALAATQKPTSTRTLLQRISAMFARHRTGCQVSNLHHS